MNYYEVYQHTYTPGKELTFYFGVNSNRDSLALVFYI